MTPASRTAAWAHLEELADDHGIRLRKAKSRKDCECHVPTRQVWVPPRMTDVLAYLEALHELGHIVHPRANEIALAHHRIDFSRDMQATEEALAWSWAVGTALPELLKLMTNAQWDRVGHMWASYLR